MPEKELSTIDQAFRDVPKAWYEMDYNFHMALTVGSSLAIYYANKEVFHLDSLPVHVTMATLFVISVLADRYSTYQAMKADSIARQNNIETNSGEKNLLLSNIRDPKEFMLSKKLLLIDLLGITGTVIYPSVGAGYILGKTLAVANNFRVARRINRMIEIERSKTN